MNKNKRPFIAADAVNDMSMEWAQSNKFHKLSLDGPNRWRKVYELPKLIIKDDRIIEDYENA